MSVSITTNLDRANGDGSTTIFNFTFRVFDANTVKVFTIDVNFIATEVTSGITKNLNASGIGGNVTFDTAPADNLEVLIVREMPFDQPTDFSADANFPEADIEKTDDKAMLHIQELEERNSRSLLFTRGSNLKDKFINEPVVLQFPRWKNDETGIEWVSANDILNAASGDDFWESSANVVIANGQGTPAPIVGMSVDSITEDGALWLFRIHRHTSSDERLTIGLLPVALNKASAFALGSAFNFPIVGVSNGVTFSIVSATVNYISTTLSGTSYVGKITFKKVILKV